jgi:hypothetical protein
MPDDRYTDTGHRGDDPRHGFGDDMGTRVGRPDGARATRSGGNPSTNDEPVADGLEGSIDQGEQQERVQQASRTPDPATGRDKRIDDL